MQFATNSLIVQSSLLHKWWPVYSNKLTVQADTIELSKWYSENYTE